MRLILPCIYDLRTRFIYSVDTFLLAWRHGYGYGRAYFTTLALVLWQASLANTRFRGAYENMLMMAICAVLARAALHQRQPQDPGISLLVHPNITPRPAFASAFFNFFRKIDMQLFFYWCFACHACDIMQNVTLHALSYAVCSADFDFVARTVQRCGGEGVPVDPSKIHWTPHLTSDRWLR